MRKILTFLLLFACMGIIAVSCRDEDPVSGPEPTGASLKSGKGNYSSIDDSKGLFKITLSGEEIDFHLQFIADRVPDAELLNAQLTAESYAVAGTGNKYTLTPESYWLKGSEKSPITSGNVTVKRNGDKYVITGIVKNAADFEYEITFDDVIDIEPEYEVEYTKQNGWYWGDDPYQFPNIGEYMSYFAEGQTNSYGELTGDGYYLNISFFNEMDPRAWEAQIPNQTYTASTDYAVGTFRIASKEEIAGGAPYYQYASLHHIDETKGIDKEVFITGGTVHVMPKGDQQEVRFNFELQDGTRHIAKYTGVVRQKDEYTVSTLLSDQQISDITHGYLEYRGKSPIAGLTNNRWDMYLLTENATVMPDFYWIPDGSGNILRVTLYTAPTETTEIPAGTYPIGEEVAGNAGTGQGYEVGLDFGTWFYELKSGEYENYAPIKTGTVDISKEGDAYKVTLTGVDDRQNKITATYTGELAFVDHGKGGKAAPQARTRKKVAPAGKLYNWKKKRRTFTL